MLQFNANKMSLSGSLHEDDLSASLHFLTISDLLPTSFYAFSHYLNLFTLLLSGTLGQRGTCIKWLIWPPLEPKSEIAFHQFLFTGLLEE